MIFLEVVVLALSISTDSNVRMFIRCEKSVNLAAFLPFVMSVINIRSEWIKFITSLGEKKQNKTEQSPTSSIQCQTEVLSLFSSPPQANSSLTLAAALKATWVCLWLLNESLCGYKSVAVLINAALGAKALFRSFPKSEHVSGTWLRKQ